MNKYGVFWTGPGVWAAVGAAGIGGVIVFAAMQKIRVRAGQNIYHETQTRNGRRDGRPPCNCTHYRAKLKSWLFGCIIY